MAWTFRTFLGKWKPTAKGVVACLLKCAGGVAAATDPSNELLYKCLTAGTEQAAEHLFDTLPAEQKREVEDRFALLQPYLDQHAALIRRLETLVDQQTGQGRTTEALLELIRTRLPADLQPELQRCLRELSGIQSWLQKLHQDVMHRFDRLEHQPKSPYWISIDDQADVEWLRALHAESRKWSPEQRRQLRPTLFAGLLQDAGLHEAASVTCGEAVALADDVTEKSALWQRKMRADLERLKLDEALLALREAITLDPASAPFPAKKYEPRRILGIGGFGMAVLCRDRYQENLEIVVKCLHVEGLDRAPKELFREAPLLRELAVAHPNLFVNVHDVAFADALAERRPYIVMDYFPGVTLTQWLKTQLPKEQGLPLADFRAIARKIAQAVHAAHQRGIFHRDLKPDNVLVRRDGGRWDVRVIDFGLALRCESLQRSVLHQAYSRTLLGAAAAGTAKFAPPEQMGELNHPVGPYSDVYAFGKTCCELLFRDLEPKRRHWQSLDEPLAEMLEKCLERKPEDRHLDFKPILAALQGEEKARQDAEKKQRAEAERQRFAQEQATEQRRQAETARQQRELLERQEANRRLQASAASRSSESAQQPSDSGVKPSSGRALGLLLLAVLLVLVVLGGFWWANSGNKTPDPKTADAVLRAKKFVKVSKGKFWMGGGSASPPTKEVEIAKDFELGVYPVTQREWQAVMGNNPSYFSRSGVGAGAVQNISDEDLARFPVERVSWNEVQKFIDKLNTREKVASGWVYRLPTEAEWEYACRGGRIYKSKDEWSSDFYFDQPTNELTPKQANFNNNVGRPTPVGSYPPNKLGLYDMHGNVWQWTSSLYEEGGSPRVIRGGDWNGAAAVCTASFRYRYEPDFACISVGFRLLAVPSGKK